MIQQLADLRRRLEAAEGALTDALAAMKQAEGAFDAAADASTRPSVPWTRPVRTARGPRVGCAAYRCTSGEPSWEPLSTDVQPHRTFASAQSISLTWCLAPSSHIVPRGYSRSRRGGQGFIPLARVHRLQARNLAGVPAVDKDPETYLCQAAEGSSLKGR